MKILKIKTKECLLSYTKPIKVSGSVINERVIYELDVTTDHGTQNSELSLIENFHEVSYSKCLNEYGKKDIDYKALHPQISYPIDMAVFSLAHTEVNSGEITANAYYDPSMQDDVPNIECLKIKIARDSFDKDYAIISKLKDKRLRLDANRLLNKKQFESYLDLNSNYDYFEEPFMNALDMMDYPNARFALDENVCDEELQSLKQVKAYVLKPSLLGFETTLRLIEKAKKLGKRVIISSTFEGELGHLMLCKMAQYSDDYLGYKEEHGLGTISFLPHPFKYLRISAVDSSIKISF